MRILKNWFPLPVQDKTQIITNLKRNWYFPVSAMAFFCVSARLTAGYFMGLLIALLAAIIVASQVPSVWPFAKEKSLGLRIASLLTAAGICWAGGNSFYTAWSISPKTQAVAAMLPLPIDVPGIISTAGAVAALLFVSFYVLVFWEKVTNILSKNHVFYGVTHAERVVYGILLLGAVILSAVVFAQTDAFYGTAYDYDVIYTGDSPALVKDCAYLTLTHLQNDLRQPLFAVFAGPFLGLPYLLGKLTGSVILQAILMNSIQIVMLFAAHFLLAKMLKLSPAGRICFLLLTSFTYTHLLFMLMMEQYIIAYFWMIFCMYLIAEAGKPERFALWGAGGTLLTSMILLPFMSDKHPIKQFGTWFWDMVKLGLSFVGLMLVFCRFDVIFDLTSKIVSLSDFGGAGLTMLEKLYQYTAFVIGCFAAPNAGVNTTTFDHISWQLNPVTDIHWLGVAIVVLAVVSFLCNRKKKVSQFAAAWIALSWVMLLVLGWGTGENGLILYGLYFGWAFLALLVQLVETIERKCNVNFLLPVICIGGAVALAAVNFPAIEAMLRFAIAHYPA